MGRWKAKERELAKLLGGKRTGPTGKDNPDVLHPTLAPELKTMKRLPKWLLNFVQQAVDNAPPDKLPFVVMQQKGMEWGDTLVVVRMRHWVEWYGDVHAQIGPQEG